MIGRSLAVSAVSVFLVAACSSFARPEEFKLPTPAPAPAVKPYLGEGEKYYYFDYQNVIPGTRFFKFWWKGTAIHCNTSQSVGDGVGMYYYAPGGGEPGWICAYDTGVQQKKDKEGKLLYDDHADYKGISLWIKGDGSDATAVISTDFAGSKHKFRIPLKDTNWHKVFMPWEKWDTPPTYFWFLTYGLERKGNDATNWYIIDRVRLYKEERTEEIKPTPDVDPPGNVPAKAFVGGQENIAKTVAKLKAKQPVKIVIAGDSNGAGAQLGYEKIDRNEPTHKYTFWWVLADRLKEAFGYAGVSQVLHNCTDAKTGKWADNPTPRPEADLCVVAVATGGWTSKMGLDHIDEVLAEKPDLVVWEYGGNDAIYRNAKEYAKATEEVVEKLKAAGTEVVILTVAPSADIVPKNYLENKSPVERMGEVAAEGRRIAAEKKCAVADSYKALTCRGILFVGDLYSDFVHLNRTGHEMTADLLDALITGRDVKIWKYGPAAEKGK